MWPRRWVELQNYSSMTAALEGGEWSAARPGRTLPPGKDPLHILQEAGLAPRPVWTGRKARLHRDSMPDRPARSQSLYRLSYPVHSAHIYRMLITRDMMLSNASVHPCVQNFEFLKLVKRLNDFSLRDLNM